jgi:hypothetical protein
VRLSIFQQGAVANDYFKVNGIAVVPYAKPTPFSFEDKVLLDREKLFNEAYKYTVTPHVHSLDVATGIEAASLISDEISV